jgi:hypothetical protein
VPLTYRRDGKEFDIRVRLASVHREGELADLLNMEQQPPLPIRPPEGDQPPPGKKDPPPNAPAPGKDRNPGEPPRRLREPGRHGIGARKPKPPKAIRQVYEEAPGYANFWFNRYHQQRVWNAYLAQGDFADTGWNWNVTGQAPGGGEVRIELAEKQGSIVMPTGESSVEFGPSLTEATGPPHSGGLLAALHLWQRLLLFGPQRFGEVYYVGTLPWGAGGELADCLAATHGGVETKFYFDPEKSHLIGIEMQLSDDEDPCEIHFDDIRPVEGRSLPHHWKIVHGDDVFAGIRVSSYDWSSGKAK